MKRTITASLPSSKVRSKVFSITCARLVAVPRTSEQKITLRHRQHVGRCAGEKLAVGGDLVGLGIDRNRGRGAVMDHVFLADLARVLDRDELFLDAKLAAQAAAYRRLGREHHRTRGQG